MQTIDIYLKYSYGNVSIVNAAGATNVTQSIIPVITRGMKFNLMIHFVTISDDEVTEDTSIADLSAWEFAVTKNYGTEGEAVILSVEEISKSGGNFTVPINANTDELIAALGTEKSLTTYGAVLKGYDSSTDLAFSVDFPVTLLNIRNTGGEGPSENIINYYTKAQVDAKVNALFDWADPYDFTTTTETGETVTFTAAALGVDAESCDFDVIQIDGDDKITVTNDASIFRKWTPDGYVVMYAGGWPAGTWQLRAGKVKGDAGRDGMFYDRETSTGSGGTVTIVASELPKAHYYTAVSGDTLAVDWTSANGKDATVWIKLTMPSTPVTITLPSDIDKWKDDFGNDTSAPDMSTAGIYWIFIHKDANYVWATGKKVA